MPDATLPASQCFAIFEGGGAKGITHLGALKAMEDVQLARIGAAGTSAGAIIAVLTAIGYTADELFKPSGANILGKRDKTPIDLLGRDDWGLFCRLRGPGSDVSIVRRAQTILKRALLGAMALVPPLLPLWAFSLARSTGRPVLFRCAWRILETFGFFSTEGARDLLNELLCDKLGLPRSHLVRFKDIDPEVRSTCCALKIITTNLSRGSIELFDRTTPEVVVADAVAASFSIPVFFKPSRIRGAPAAPDAGIEGGDLYVDGGLLSNLPVWVFFEDKRAVERLPEYRKRPPIPIVAFRLDAPDQPRVAGDTGNPVRRCVSYVGDVVRTGIFGGQSITQHFITHLTVVSLPTPLTVIQFDCTKAQALSAYTYGYEAALKQLQWSFRITPFARQEGLENLLAQVEARSRQVRAAAGCEAVGRFRACLLRPLGDRSLKVVASINMQDDADDDLVLDQQNPGAPTAYYQRDFTFVDLTVSSRDLRMTKYERALVRPGLKSVIAVPIFKDNQWDKEKALRDEPVGAFCLDSDLVLDLEVKDEDFMRILSTGTILFAPVMLFKEDEE